MPGRRKDLRPHSGRDAPGAGSYNPNMSTAKKSNPNFSVSKSKRDASLSLFSNTPGAGAYLAKDILIKTHSASWKIGSEKRPY